MFDFIDFILDYFHFRSMGKEAGCLYVVLLVLIFLGMGIYFACR